MSESPCRPQTIGDVRRTFLCCSRRPRPRPAPTARRQRFKPLSRQRVDVSMAAIAVDIAFSPPSPSVIKRILSALFPSCREFFLVSMRRERWRRNACPPLTPLTDENSPSCGKRARRDGRTRGADGLHRQDREHGSGPERLNLQESARRSRRCLERRPIGSRVTPMVALDRCRMPPSASPGQPTDS